MPVGDGFGFIIFSKRYREWISRFYRFGDNILRNFLTEKIAVKERNPAHKSFANVPNNCFAAYKTAKETPLHYL